MFNLCKILIIIMLRYKGKYYQIWQYMPKNLIKWGVKIWCLINSALRYMWDFNGYQDATKVDSTTSKSKKD